MNKGFKRVVAISLILIFLGIALVTGALVASKGDFKTITGAFQNLGVYWDDINAIEKTQTFDMEPTLSSVNISFINSDITVSLSPDKKVHVSYEKRKNYTYSESTSGDKLSVSENANWFFNFSLKRSKVLISIPSDTLLYECILKNVSGAISVEDLVSEHLELSGVDTTATVLRSNPATFTFNTVNGNLSLQKSSSNSVTFKSVNGSTNIAETNFKDFTMNTTNGDATIILASKKDDYKVDYGVVNGTLQFNGDTFKGSTILNGVMPPNSVIFKAVNGSMTLKTIE